MDELLLDSTYLLPIFGLEIDLKGFATSFPLLLDCYSVTYNPVALVEAKWVVIRFAKKYPSKKERLLQAYRDGLRTLQGEKRLKQTILTNQAVEEIADRILKMNGVKDYFDRLTYATAAHNNVLLLTEDRELCRLTMTDSIPRPRKATGWNEIVQNLR